MMMLNKILADKNNTKHATDNGTKTHKMLQHIVIDNNTEIGDSNLISHIKKHPDLIRFFDKNAKTEVPIAGTINGRFVSRRIDRLCIDSVHKHIDIIDYKTDINHETFYTMYLSQVREYYTLLKSLYPDYHIDAYILWTHDFSLEKISIK